MGAALTLLVFLMGVGALVILHQISNQTKKQIELDQLTGSIAIQFRASIITMEDSKKRLRIAHAVMLAGCLDILACTSFRDAYQLEEKVEQAIQTMAKTNWNAQSVRWLGFQPLLSTKGALPKLDDVEEQSEAKITVKLGSLLSTAKLWKTKGMKSNGWKIAWTE